MPVVDIPAARPAIRKPSAGGADDRGFTLLELIVVVVVIGILAAIAIPAYTGTMRSSHKAVANSWVTSATTSIYIYYLTNGTMPASPAAAGAATPANDLSTQYYAGTNQFCLSAFWTGAPAGGWFGPTDDTWKVVFIPDWGRSSLVPVSPASYCVNNGG